MARASGLMGAIQGWLRAVLYVDGADVGAANPLPVTGMVSSSITTPTQYTVDITLADTEYSQALPANCKGFELRCRQASDLRIAFVTGKVAAPTDPYWSIPAGQSYYSFQIDQGASPSTVYVASEDADVDAEMIVWA